MIYTHNPVDFPPKWPSLALVLPRLTSYAANPTQPNPTQSSKRSSAQALKRGSTNAVNWGCGACIQKKRVVATQSISTSALVAPASPVPMRRQLPGPCWAIGSLRWQDFVGKSFLRSVGVGPQARVTCFCLGNKFGCARRQQRPTIRPREAVSSPGWAAHRAPRFGRQIRWP